MSNINFNCDVCGREVQGSTFVNGMKFCAKCYQETFGEIDKDRKIADLEAKLAEKDKEIEKLNACVDFYKSYYISFKEKVIDELEKVKEKINNCPITDYDTNKHFVKMYQSDAIRQVDNQIKQLKEMMKSE